MFAGYIAYCSQQGIINGYSDGNFRPAGTLTGYAFMKMLLTSLGYSTEAEGFTGPNWTINVAKLTSNLGLDKGNDEFSGAAAVTREEASLYAFNTLQADLVEYEKGNTVIINGQQITSSTDRKAKAIKWLNSSDANGNIEDDDYIQFAEQYFNKLKKVSSTDDFARPSTKWTFKGDKIGNYVDTPDATYTKNVKLGQIYSDLNMTQKDGNAEVWVNGVKRADVAVSKNNDVKIASKSANKDLVGDGSIVDVFYNDDENHVTICVIDVYVGEVTSVNKKASVPYVSINMLSGEGVGAGTVTGGSSKVNVKYEYDEGEEFAEDDIVLYTVDAKADGSPNDDVVTCKVISPAVTGELTKITFEKNMDVAGTNYKYSRNIGFDPEESALDIKSEYNVYVDDNGLVIFVREEEFNPDDYAFVLNVESAKDIGFKYDQAKLVLADGTLKTVKTDDDYTELKGKIVYYRQDSDGEYILREAPNSHFNGSGTAADSLYSDTTPAATISSKGVAQNGVLRSSDFEMKNNQAKIKAGNGDTLYANSETVFVVYNDDTPGDSTVNGDYTAYVGIKNAPTIDFPSVDGAETVEMYWYERSNNILAFVFIDATGMVVEDGGSNIVFLAAMKGMVKRTIDSDNKAYYTYNAVVGDEITTVKVLAEQVTGSEFYQAGSDKANFVYRSPSYNNRDMIKALKDFYDDSNSRGTKYQRIGVQKTNDDGDELYVKVDGTNAESTAVTDRPVMTDYKGIWKLSGKYTIGLGGPKASESTRYTVATDAKIYRIDTDGVITKIDIGDVYSDNDDVITALMDTSSGDIAYLFIQEVDEDKTDTATTPVDPDAVAATATKSGDYEITFDLDGVAKTTYSITMTRTTNGVERTVKTFKVTTDANGDITTPEVIGGLAVNATYDFYLGDTWLCSRYLPSV